MNGVYMEIKFNDIYVYLNFAPPLNTAPVWVCWRQAGDIADSGRWVNYPKGIQGQGVHTEPPPEVVLLAEVLRKIYRPV